MQIITKKLEDDLRIIKLFDPKLLRVYFSNTWKISSGAMVISYESLASTQFDFKKLVPHIKTRIDRMAFERIFALSMWPRPCSATFTNLSSGDIIGISTMMIKLDPSFDFWPKRTFYKKKKFLQVAELLIRFCY